jgi:hypothetical protein
MFVEIMNIYEHETRSFKNHVCHDVQKLPDCILLLYIKVPMWGINNNNNNKHLFSLREMGYKKTNKGDVIPYKIKLCYKCYKHARLR